MGRPNVGKSTLFNRIVGRRLAIVEERPKVTRDRRTERISWAGHSFDLVDTGGWLAGGDALDEKVSAQAEAAVKEASLVLFVLDVNVGITEEDLGVAKLLRRLSSKVFVIANKVDSAKSESSIWDFTSLGFGDPIGVSALHGRNSGDLLDSVVTAIEAPYFDDWLAEKDNEDDADSKPKQRKRDGILSIAVVGRPNVGKSTLFNRLIGEERSVTHDMPGTTTDSVDTVVEMEGVSFRFIDTAGMRRKAKIEEALEYFSMVRTLRAIDNSDIALLVIDSTDGITAQDQRLAERIDAAGSPAIVLMNKWDKLDALTKENVEEQIGDRLSFLTYITPLRISALSGRNVSKIWQAITEAEAAYSTRIPTRALNELMAQAQAAHAPKGTKILYAVQGAVDPPTFTLFATRAIEPGYMRYLEKKIRERFGLGPTPIKMRVRKR